MSNQKKTLLVTSSLLLLVLVGAAFGFGSGQIKRLRERNRDLAGQIESLSDDYGRKSRLSQSEIEAQAEIIDRQEEENETLTQNLKTLNAESEDLNARVEELTVEPIAAVLAGVCESGYAVDAREPETPPDELVSCTLVDEATGEVLYTFRETLTLEGFRLGKQTETKQHVLSVFGDGGVGRVKVYSLDRYSGQVYEGPGATSQAWFGVEFLQEDCADTTRYERFNEWLDACIPEARRSEINYSQFQGNRETARLLETFDNPQEPT